MVCFVTIMPLQMRVAVSLGVLITWASTLAQAQAGLSIDSPREFQVVQRQSKASGTILAAGRLDSIDDRCAVPWIPRGASGRFRRLVQAGSPADQGRPDRGARRDCAR